MRLVAVRANRIPLKALMLLGATTTAVRDQVMRHDPRTGLAAHYICNLCYSNHLF
jgi:hypothetical protein